jgi:hypothetical protein
MRSTLTGGALDASEFAIQLPQGVVQTTSARLLDKYRDDPQAMGKLPSGELLYNVLQSAYDEVCKYIYVDVYVDICKYACMHVDMCSMSSHHYHFFYMSANVYANIHINAHTYEYIHTYICVRRGWNT